MERDLASPRDEASKEPVSKTRYRLLYLCFATYALNIPHNSDINVTLISLSRTRFPKSYEDHKTPRCVVNWTSTQAYVSYFGTDSKLYVFNYQLYQQSLRKSDTEVPLYSNQTAGQDQKLIMDVQLDIPTTSEDLSVQFFTARLQNPSPYLLVNRSSNDTGGSLFKITLSEDVIKRWMNIKDKAANVEAFQPTLIDQAYVKLYKKLSWLTHKDQNLLYNDAQSLSHSLCTCCNELIRKSRLLNNPSLWIQSTSHHVANDQTINESSTGTRGRQQGKVF